MFGVNKFINIKEKEIRMKKKIISILAVVSVLLVSTVSSFALFTPIEGDIYYNLGAVPGKDLVISQVASGIQLQFKKTGDMWAARASLEYPYDLSKEKGISSQISDIDWPLADSSIAFCITMTQGGWSDTRSMIFRVVNRDAGGTYPNGYVEGIIGFGSEETDHSVYMFMNATALDQAITDSIEFSFKKKNNTQWAMVLNGQEFIVPNSFVSTKFTVLNPMYLCYGTWSSAGAVTYTVSKVDFDGAFDDVPAATPTTSVSSSAPASSAPVSSAPVSSAVQSSVPVSSEIAQSSEAVSSEAEVSEEVSSEAQESQEPASSDEDVSSEVASSDESEVSTAAESEDDGEEGMSIWFWVFIIFFVLVAGGGAALYFLYFKKIADKE